MDTPIYDFVQNYAAANPLRLHMPGHKGYSVLGTESSDITEINGADVLYHPEGIIRKSEDNAAALFGTARTIFSTEGSSLPIRAMLYLAKRWAAQNVTACTIAAGRNAHKVFITASALLNIDVRWLYPKSGTNLISCTLTASDIKQQIDHMDCVPTAVYITSPDYLGNIADIEEIAQVCRQRNILLLVDNAHGAYLNFLPESIHPMALGADMCCDSAHKTLPVLTGGAYLHIGKNAPEFFSSEADRAMDLFASTSPSYLIMQSLDLANRYLESGYREKLKYNTEQWQQVRKELSKSGYLFTGNEPLKMTILAKPYGYTGTELTALLEENNIFCEFADPDHVVLMLSPEFTDGDREKILNVLKNIPQKKPIFRMPPKILPSVPEITAHDVLFRPTETVPIENSIGKIIASPTVSCPPAIPIVSCGERITENAVQAMQYYGIESVTVLE